MKLSAIFEEKPERWGFRGDPYFWDHLKERAEHMEILSPDELEAWVKGGVPLLKNRLAGL